MFAQRRTLAAANDAVASTQKFVGKAEEYVQKIDAAFAKVEAQKERYKSMIDGAEKQASLPRAILPNSGDKNYALILNEITIKPTGTVIEMYMKIPGGKDHNGNKQHLYFIAEVPFSSRSGIVGDARLYLLKNCDININKDTYLSFNGLESGKFDSTFVTMNCKGFKDITLNGKLVFNKEFIQKEADTTKKEVAPDPLEMKFYIQADKFANFVIKFRDIPKFQFKKLPDFSCKIDTLVLDMSEVRNAPLFTFPEGYILSPNFTANPNLWKGLYISKMRMEIPPVFKEDGSTGKANKPIDVTIKDLVIDENGLNIDLKAKNVLRYGNVKGFAISIENLSIKKLSTQDEFTASMDGRILLPMSKDSATSRIDYSAYIFEKGSELDLRVTGTMTGNNKYGKPKSVVSFNALGAKADLTKVGLTFYYSKKDLDIAIDLDGKLAVKSNDDPNKAGDGVAFVFKNLNISTRQPYIFIGDGGGAGVNFGSAASTMSRFPVQVTKAELMTKDNGQKMGLDLGLALNLMKSGNDSQGASGFKADAGLEVWAKRDAATGKWGFDNVNVKKISLEVNNSAYTLKGTIMKFDKEGDKGFCGNIQLKVIKKIEVEASVIFGKRTPVLPIPTGEKDEVLMQDAPQVDGGGEFRFWYVDAKVGLTPSIPVFTGFGINAFNGALYHNMGMVLSDGGTPPESPVAECKTASGKSFVPNDKIFLGFQAGIGLASMPSDAVFKGNVTFGMEFKSDGGVRLVTLDGFVSFLNGSTPPTTADNVAGKAVTSKSDKETSKGDPEGSGGQTYGMLAAEMEMLFDVDNSIFKGDFRIFVNASGIVKGGYNAKGYAGKMEMYFSSSKWYVYIGRPAGGEIKLEILSLFTAQTYICAGYLPNPPISPLPDVIRNMFGDGFNPDAGAVEGSTGLSFGARVGLEKEFNASIAGFGLYARVYAQIGFDVVISKTPTPVYCSGSSQERGINNWYAVGQAFISAGGEVGVEVFGQRISVLEGGIHAGIFAQLPKPTYLVGAVRVEVSVNLLVKKLSFGGDLKMEFGEQCGTPPSDTKKTKIMTGISPALGAVDQPVFTTVKVFFNKSLGDESKFSIKSEGGDGTSSNTFRFEIGSIILKNGTKDVLFDQKWDNGGRLLNLIPKTVLPEGVWLDCRVIVKLQIQSGGGWQDAIAGVDTMTTRFLTKLEPRNIETSNIYYSYPMPNMDNYYIGESNTGYLRTKVVPRLPLALASGFGMEMQILEGDKVVAHSNVQTNTTTGLNNFTYDIPNDKLSVNKTYTFRIIKTQINAQSADNEDKGNEVVMGYQNPRKDSAIVSFEFKTSKFRTFAEKIAQFAQVDEKVDNDDFSIFQVYKSVDMNVKDLEAFSMMEAEGVKEGDLVYVDQMVKPINYSVDQIFSSGIGLSTDENTVDFSIGSTMSIKYFGLTQAKVAQKSATIARGNYIYKVGYFLPGQTSPNSTVNLNFNLPKELKLN